MNILNFMDELNEWNTTSRDPSSADMSHASLNSSTAYLQSPINTSHSTFAPSNARMRNSVKRNCTLASPLIESKELPGKTSRKKHSYGNNIFSYNVHKPLHTAQTSKSFTYSPKSRLPLKPSVTIASIDTFANFQKSSSAKRRATESEIEPAHDYISTEKTRQDSIGSASLFSAGGSQPIPDMTDVSIATSPEPEPISYTSAANSSLSLSVDLYCDILKDVDTIDFDSFAFSAEDKPFDPNFGYTTGNSALGEFTFDI